VRLLNHAFFPVLVVGLVFRNGTRSDLDLVGGGVVQCWFCCYFRYWWCGGGGVF
jgi:hypothetical protein